MTFMFKSRIFVYWYHEFYDKVPIKLHVLHEKYTAFFTYLVKSYTATYKLQILFQKNKLFCVFYRASDVAKCYIGKYISQLLGRYIMCFYCLQVALTLMRLFVLSLSLIYKSKVFIATYTHSCHIINIKNFIQSFILQKAVSTYLWIFNNPLAFFLLWFCNLAVIAQQLDICTYAFTLLFYV